MLAPDERQTLSSIALDLAREVSWAAALGREVLMVPGPTELPFRVLQALHEPPQLPYDAAFDEGVLDPARGNLGALFGTDTADVLVLPGSTRTALESALLSVIEPGQRAVVVVAGVFGQLICDMLERLGASVTSVAVPWGQPIDLHALAQVVEQVQPHLIAIVHTETSTGATYPPERVGAIARATGALFLLDAASSLGGIEIRMDGWGVDLCAAGSQKCLAAPLGLGLLAVSHLAWRRMETRRRRPASLTYDLLRWRELWLPVGRGGHRPNSRPRWKPVAVPTHLTAALAAALELIEAEGLPRRFARHELAARAFRAGLEAMSLMLYPDPALASATVTSFRSPLAVPVDAIVRHMRHTGGILISPGLDRLARTTLRVGHMGVTASPFYVLPTLSALELALQHLGYRCTPGAAVAAAHATFGGMPW